jgi:hypothetical protein
MAFASCWPGRRGLGKLGKDRPKKAKITAEAVVAMTMDFSGARDRSVRARALRMGPAVNNFARAQASDGWVRAAWIAAAAWGCCGSARAASPDIAPPDRVSPASVFPEVEVVPGGTVVGESVLADVPRGPAEEPGILDVSSRVADGMMLEDFRLDEMPFEASSGDWFWNGGWYVAGESLWMDRSRNNRRVIAEQLYVEPFVGERRLKFTTAAQPFNVAPGARVTIGKSLGRDHLDRDRAFEFIYYGGMSYEDIDGRNAVNNGTFFSPLAPLAPGFNGANAYATKFSSNFNSWEWNYKLRRRLGRDQLVMSPGGNWTRHAERGWLPALILGTRLANVNEQFSVASSRSDVPQDQFSGRYHIDAGNWLLGLNIGGELISQNEFFYWGLRGRAAPALTFASTEQQAAGIDTVLVPPGGRQTVAFADQATRTGPGFLGDLTLMAGWNITPNFALQVGYDFLWVAGMATATRQFNLDNRDVNAIDVGGQTFYNGVSFGFYGSW